MGNNLRKLRELKGWTHDEAANAMELSRGGYKRLKRPGWMNFHLSVLPPDKPRPLLVSSRRPVRIPVVRDFD